jgi:uncharacterized protein (DUF433 family)
MPVKTSYEHIVLDENNVPQITDANTKVVEIVLDQLAYGWSAEEIHLQHPHLSLGQIHSALAYYWDHQAELEEDIQRRLAEIERIGAQTQPTPLVRRLRAQGLLR